MHQPLHDEDNGDKGGNDRHALLEGHPDNLHWLWDTGLLVHINRNPEALAGELESRITPQDRAAWTKRSIEEWVMEVPAGADHCVWRIGQRGSRL